jgi:anaerobic selenocysteine-containing dehydrogenase
MERMNRRSFVKVAGAATGAAAIGAAPSLARAASGDDAKAIEPTTGVPDEPIVAYVRDAKRGEVTVVAGTSEQTYRDPKLVERLSQAAPRQKGVK